jgi:ribosomal protein S18 acetylase RimI-like enzyme
VVQPPPAFTLPAALLSLGYAARPETDTDVDFLMRLYASTREADLALLPLTPQQKAAFVAQQFFAQRAYYRGYGDSCAFIVIERHGEPVGRLYLNAEPSRLQLVDITLSPERRGEGLGAALLQALHAQTGGKPLGAFVAKTNRAQRLYQRLGFVEIADDGVYLEIEWPPSAGDAGP